MFARRCTRKLLDRLPKGSAIGPEPSTTVLGTLNDFAFMFQVQGAHHPKMSLMERTLSLAHTPCGAIDHAFADDATRAAGGA